MLLPPRKNRTPLAQKHSEQETYPTLLVGLQENPTPDKTHEISVLDINTAGMGIACNIPLNVGQRVFFYDGQTEWDLPEHGIVMWTFQDSNGFRAGIKFA